MCIGGVKDDNRPIDLCGEDLGITDQHGGAVDNHIIKIRLAVLQQRLHALAAEKLRRIRRKRPTVNNKQALDAAATNDLIGAVALAQQIITQAVIGSVNRRAIRRRMREQTRRRSSSEVGVDQQDTALFGQ